MGSQSDKTEFRQLRDTIYTFFYYSNKPMIITELALQFKNHKKAMIEKVLDDLVTKKKIFLKLFGKSKIYCLSQDMIFTIDEQVYTDEIDQEQIKIAENSKNPLDAKDFEDKILRYLKWNYEEKAKEFAVLKEESKELDALLAEFDNQMSIEELNKAIKDMKETVNEFENLGEIKTINTADFNKRKKEHLLIKKELSKRKNLFKEMVDNICDGMSIKKKDFLSQAGVEE